MLKRIKTIHDIVNWGLCVGCGACYFICRQHAIILKDSPTIGIIPSINRKLCNGCMECVEVCPGLKVEAQNDLKKQSRYYNYNLLIGPTQEIWEGYANDAQIHYQASSGGILTAIALYCLEKENMELVLHTGMSQSEPWKNETVQSRTKNELLSRTGSRYSSSSPCDSLEIIEKSKRPCVFIGKPCDVAAINKLRKQRPMLDANLGLVLTFFCAGTPNTQGTISLLELMGIKLEDVRSIRYRGCGWPGNFRVNFNNDSEYKSLKYIDSWDYLQKYRSFRCQLCADGLGELGDISCGDAWHRHFDNDNNTGCSLILTRTKRGTEILRKAAQSNYINIIPSEPQKVIEAQSLIQRRQHVFGRLLAMNILLIPTPHYQGFNLFNSWIKLSIITKIKTIFGTLRRLIKRGLWHRRFY